MTTLFALLRDRCGLSQTQTAAMLGVSLGSIKSWDTGRRTAPSGAIADLRALYRRIEDAVGHALALIEDVSLAATEIDLGLASDDYEAQSLGLPCVGAHEALLGLVAARLDRPVRIVPRGTTAATAGAADAHERGIARRR